MEDGAKTRASGLLETASRWSPSTNSQKLSGSSSTRTKARFVVPPGFPRERTSRGSWGPVTGPIRARLLRCQALRTQARGRFSPAWCRALSHGAALWCVAGYSSRSEPVWYWPMVRGPSVLVVAKECSTPSGVAAPLAARLLAHGRASGYDGRSAGAVSSVG